jgi:hypothetical protein
MAPEQTTGDTQLDGRADIYALGCVLYEMLGGSPPFSGATAGAVIARHRTDTPPSLLTLRVTVPPALEAVVMRALAKSPADRFPTATSLARALGPGSGSMPAIAVEEAAGTGDWRRLAGIAIGIVSIALVWIAMSGRGSSARDLDVAAAFSAANLDTTRYAVLPFEYDSDISSRFNEDQMLLDAMARWDGITMIDAFQLRGVMRTEPGAALDDEAGARRAAAQLGAGRMIRGQVSRAPGGYRVNALLIETATGDVIERGALRLPASLQGVDSSFRMLAEGLLLREAGEPLAAGDPTTTTSLPARQAFVSGWNAVREWDLARADSHFTASARLDPEYAQALLWSALTRSWSGQPASTWRSEAERAVAGRSGLNQRDQRVADAILASARGDLVASCRVWSELTSDHGNDFVPWYGLGDCQSRDSIVLADRTSPTGWRFRTSYHSALRAYQRALQLLPSIHEGLSTDAYEPVRRLFKLTPTSTRMGISQGAAARAFVALPTINHDSLAFIPVPMEPGVAIPSSPTAIDAVRHQRQQFFEIATAWSTSLPESATARAALALSMELLGQPGALEVLREARRLASEPADRFRLAAAEVWLRIRLAAPSDTAGLRAARKLADSLLDAGSMSGAPPLSRASLAALTGRAGLAVSLAGDPFVQRAWDVPAALFPAASRLLVHAAMGGPSDSLRRLERDVDAAIGRDLARSQRDGARLAWIARAATLAFPTHRFAQARELVGAGDYVLDAMEALATADTNAARRAFYEGLPGDPMKLTAERPADALFPEAWLFAALHEDRTAIHWLDNVLANLYGKALRAPIDPIEAAPLVRAMALRAELAARTGDAAGARGWARTVSILWSDADASLEPVVRQMQVLLK